MIVPSSAPDWILVWRITLVADAATLALAGRLLDAEERGRADRFVFPEHRRRFVLRRAARRVVLAEFAGVDPRDLSFSSATGRPRLADSARDGTSDSLEFSASHSGELALLAVAPGRRVGIDVETHAGFDGDLAGMVDRLHPEERATIMGLRDVVTRRRRFFECWTRKEACVKALGTGLATPLASFRVPVEAALPFTPVAVRDPSGTEINVRLCSLDAGEACSAALAVEGGLARVEWRPWRWEGG